MLALRPLIASHKQDIIDTAFQIGTAEFAKNMPEYCGVISKNPPPAPSAIASSTRKAVRHGHPRARSGQCPSGTDRPVIDELGEDIKVEEVMRQWPAVSSSDIRHPDAAEDEPLELSGIEVQTPAVLRAEQPSELDENRQYLLYCDKGVMSRPHAHHLLSEGM